MSVGLALSGVLYPTVGLALYVAWRYADMCKRRGLHAPARVTKAAVVLVAVFPLLWALREIYRSLGLQATLLWVGGAVVAVAVMYAALRIGKSA